MKWKTPATENAWMELLSRYLDGDVSSEEHSALESYLLTDSQRMEQLRQLEETSQILQAWQIEDVTPKAEFLQKFMQEKEKQNSVSRHLGEWFMSLRWQWSSFASGAAIGIVGLLFIQNMFTAGELKTPRFMGKTTPVVNFYLSQNQAEGLLKEVNAQSLTDGFRKQIRSQKWEEAAATYRILMEQYSQTNSINNIKNDPVIQAFVQRIAQKKGV